MELALIALAIAGVVRAQSTGCLSLSGSTACPDFSSQYISPSNLSSTFGFLSTVTDVISFDSGLYNYLNTTFKTSKYQQQLGCQNTSTAYTLQYARTFVCGELVSRSYAAGCTQAPYERMTCQATCLQFAVSENLFVADQTACDATASTYSSRQGNLTYDFTTCTDWTSLISNNTATCVLGQNNEGNCGFGNSMSQLCSYCNPATKNGQLVDSCCLGGNTNLGTCGYQLNAAQVAASPTASSVNPSVTMTMSASTGAAGSGGGTAADSGSGTGSTGGSSGLSKGAIAGIVIGSVVGGLLLLALLFFLLARRRRTSAANDKQRRGLLGAAAGSSGFEDSEKGGYNKEALAAKQKKFANDSDNTPLPSPLSSGTLGLVSRDSDDSRGALGSGKSSPSITAVAAGTLAAYGAGGGFGTLREDGGRIGDRPISQDTSATGSSNERNLVPSVRDQYSSADIVPGSEVVAIYAYEPNLPDELRLQPDTVVTVRKIYDDGWAIGSATDSSGLLQEGAFPLVVCTVVGADSDNNSSNSSHMVTASEAGGQSGRPGVKAGSSRRTSSIGDTSFESAPSHAPTERGSTAPSSSGGIFGSFFRKASDNRA